MTLEVGIVCGACDWLNSYDRSTCEDCGKELALLTDEQSASRQGATEAEDASKSREIVEDRPAESAQQQAEGKQVGRASCRGGGMADGVAVASSR